MADRNRTYRSSDEEFYDDPDFGAEMRGRGAGRAGVRGRAQSAPGPNRFLDDLARLATDAAGVAQGVRREAENAFRSQAERVMGQLDVVSRDEFEAMRDLALNARAEVKVLRQRLDDLEARLDTSAKAKSSTSK